MAPDSNASSNPTAVAQDAAAEFGDAARSATGEAVAQADRSAAAVADTAEAANAEGAKAASKATDAFGEARERLNAMSSLMPDAAQQLFRPFQAGGDRLGSGVQASMSTVVQGMAEFNSKAIAAWRSNAESTLQHWQSLAGVKSLSEAIAMSAEHTRQQLEAVTAQTRELSTLATRIVRDAADPMKLTGR